jgi:hypothetical protein
MSDSDPLLRNEEGPPDSPLQSATPSPLSNSARFSIIGLTIMLSLVFLAGVAYRNSGEAGYDNYIEEQGGNPNITLISYENYTKFPLTPEQYRAECRKASGEMMHMAYWADMMMDVPHRRALGVCKSTVTYMLGSEVGLMGDLALLAQVAALADSVSLPTSRGLEGSSNVSIMNSNTGRFSLTIPNGTAASECLMLSTYALGSLESSHVSDGQITSLTLGCCGLGRSLGASPLHPRVSVTPPYCASWRS